MIDKMNAKNPPKVDDGGRHHHDHDEAITNQSSVKWYTTTAFKLGRRQQRIRDAIRRDVLFLVAGAVAYFIVAYVETHASDDEIRLNTIMQSLSEDEDDGSATIDVCTDENNHHDRIDDCLIPSQDSSTATATPSLKKGIILDAGFILTSPIHAHLARNRPLNDLLAMGNSILLTIPLAYVVYVTVWKGDFRLSFRLIATHLFRSLCGWFTYLPPDPEFLSSLYDFPEVFLCLFQECSRHNVQVDFLTFFSGHVATIVIIANHLYMANHTRMSICLHIFNWLQAIRLLATRGHYSIDLIIGYVVAAFVSSPAERLGLYYSRGIIQPVRMPGIVETFEILVGVSFLPIGQNQEDGKTVTRSSFLSQDGMAGSSSSISDDDLHNVQSETSVKIAVDIVADLILLK